MKQKICAIITLGCAIAFVGTIGALDLNEISHATALMRFAVIVPTTFISLLIGGFFR